MTQTFKSNRNGKNERDVDAIHVLALHHQLKYRYGKGRSPSRTTPSYFIGWVAGMVLRGSRGDVRTVDALVTARGDAFRWSVGFRYFYSGASN